jgi:HAD superfamily hydrolase (TIGR01509 family)
MPLAAFAFDLDGTLLDSNTLHARAWQRSFRHFGLELPLERILPLIGMGSDKLVPALLGDQAGSRAEAIRARTPRELEELVPSAEVRPFPGVAELASALRARGLRIAIATSSKKADLELVARASHFDPAAFADELVLGDEVEATKPEPDLVGAAVARLRVPAAACAMVGDTPYDAEAATRAGVVAVGVLTGVHPEQALRRAGARWVFRDLRALTAGLDQLLREV